MSSWPNYPQRDRAIWARVRIFLPGYFGLPDPCPLLFTNSTFHCILTFGYTTTITSLFHFCTSVTYMSPHTGAPSIPTYEALQKIKRKGLLSYAQVCNHSIPQIFLFLTISLQSYRIAVSANDKNEAIIEAICMAMDIPHPNHPEYVSVFILASRTWTDHGNRQCYAPASCSACSRNPEGTQR